MNLVIEYLENTCKLNKGKIAVIEEENTITYNNLLNNIKVIATNISSSIKLNDPIIVFMDKSIQTLEAFFGILYSGGCYSLVSPDLPDDRIDKISCSLKSKLIITNNEFIERARVLFKNSIVLDIDKLLLGTIDENILNIMKSKKIDIDPVYINFTSGSTGIPKGVVVNNCSIIDFINVFTKEFNIKQNDVIANQAPFDFDVSVKDIYSTMFVGATLLIIPRKLFSQPTKLLDYIDSNKATTLIWATSAICLISTFHGLDYKVPTSIDKVIFSGEVMPLKHLKIWMERLPRATFINAYGPTEITCNCTYHIIDRTKEYLDCIPIGKPFKNEKVFLLDKDNKEISKLNVVGEICVSGSCLALGYYNNSTETDKYFITNPLNSSYKELIYKTGDLAYYDNDTNLVFVGRKDFQIKYMGHRIELEEIDKEISKIDGIKRAVTVFNESTKKIIVFYIGNVLKEQIYEYLKKHVPSYMIPNSYYKVDDFKLTKNGKIDRQHLLKMIGGNQ